MTENINAQEIALTEPTPEPDSQRSMRSDIFGLGRKSLAYVIGHLATRAVSFLLLPLYTNALAPEDMGRLSLAFAFSAFGMIIYHMGLDAALMRHYVGEASERQREALTTVYLTLMLVGLVLSGVILSVRTQLAEGLLGVPRPAWIAMLTGIMFLDTLWTIPLHLYRAHEKPVPYVTLSLLNVSITMGLNILLVAYYGMGVGGALVANLTASATLFLITLPGVVRRLSLANYSTVLLKSLLKFGLPLLPAGLFTMTIELADRYLLRWLADLGTVGLYSAGYKLGLLMLILVMGFTMGWQPFFLRRGKEEGAQPLFARIATLMVAVMGTLLLVTGAWVDDLVRLPLGPITLFGEEYWSATRIVPVVMLGYLFYGLYVLLLPGIHLTSSTQWVIMFRGSGAVVNVALNIVFIPIWGAMGAALATCISFMVMVLITFLITKRLYPIPFEWGRLLGSAVVLALGFSLLQALPATIGRNLILTFVIPAGLWAVAVLMRKES